MDYINTLVPLIISGCGGYIGYRIGHKRGWIEGAKTGTMLGVKMVMADPMTTLALQEEHAKHCPKCGGELAEARAKVRTSKAEDFPEGMFREHTSSD